MRVEFATTNLEPAEKHKTSRAGQTETTASQTNASDEAAMVAEDRAQLSFDQAHVQSLQAHALAAPEIRQAKVEALGQAIASGQYSVDAAKIAAAMTAEYDSERIR